LKSERLRKLESEFKDLKQWLKLGLVPKKDIEKHKKEIEALSQKIEDEAKRLQYLKESGDEVEYSSPKRTPGQRPTFPETHTMPGGEMAGSTEQESSTESYESFEPDTTTFGDDTEDTSEKTAILDEEEENPFSDRNRWRRGILKDPDVDNW